MSLIADSTRNAVVGMFSLSPAPHPGGERRGGEEKWYPHFWKKVTPAPLATPRRCGCSVWAGYESIVRARRPRPRWRWHVAYDIQCFARRRRQRRSTIEQLRASIDARSRPVVIRLHSRRVSDPQTWRCSRFSENRRQRFNSLSASVRLPSVGFRS